MLDQDRVQSGFDLEAMIGERALTYVLVALTEAGVIPSTLSIESPPLDIRIREPTKLERLYEPDPSIVLPLQSSLAFGVEILFEHPLGADLKVTLVVDYENRDDGTGAVLVPLDLFVRLPFKLEAKLEAKLDVELVDIDTPVFGVLENEFGVTKQMIFAILKGQVDRTLDLGGLGAFKRLQDMALQKMPADGDHPAAIGLFINVFLRNGPEEDAFLPNRGDVEQALNFLPAGSDSAFATRDVYADMAKDAFNRKAEKRKDGPGFDHPLHKSPSNPDSKVIGTLDGILVVPTSELPGLPVFPNSLQIIASGELDALGESFDPDFTLTITLTPHTADDGTLEWKVDTNVSVDTLFEFLPFLVFAALTIVFGVGGLIASGILAGLLAGIDVAAGLIASAVLSGKVEDKVDAAMLDVMPDRLAIVRRRWDPFFTTLHQVVTKPQGVVINGDGIALWGTVAVGRDARPVTDVVVRDERYGTDGKPSHLNYRIRDAAAHLTEFSAIAPGTDRRPFTPPDPVADQTLYELSIEDILARTDEKRIQSNIPYLATKIHLDQGGIGNILAISERERNEVRSRLINTFRDAKYGEILADQGDDLRQEVLDEFAAAGETPTDEEIQAALDAKINTQIEEPQQAFEENELPGQVQDAVSEILSFDLAPEHFAALEKQGIISLSDLMVDGGLAGTDFQIVTLHHGDHAGLVYYRDFPRFGDPPTDNLLSLPHYRAEH